MTPKGGVIILIKSTLQSQAKPEYNTDSEILWTQLNLIGSKSVLIGAYYKPHELDQTSFAELEKIPEPCQPIKLPNLALGRLQLTKNRLATPDTNSWLQTPHILFKLLRGLQWLHARTNGDLTYTRSKYIGSLFYHKPHLSQQNFNLVWSLRSWYRFSRSKQPPWNHKAGPSWHPPL